MMPITSSPILVTGATGFLGGHIVQQLLAKGYKVRATVKDISNAKSFARLSRFPESAERLQVVEANLLSGETWDSALNGVEYVFHAAAVHEFSVPADHLDPDVVMYEPSVNGTLSILQACSRCSTVKRVIYTSCIQALSDDFDNSHVYSEKNWNTLSSRTRNPYAHSKTVAEEAAWEFMTSLSNGGGGENTVNTSFKFVSILPGIMLGPHLGGNIATSHRFLLLYLEEKLKIIANISLNIADVRDVATSEILLMESAKAEGRYCCCNKAVHMVNILQTIHENFVDVKLPSRKGFDAVMKFATANKSAAQGELQWMHYNIGRVPNISCAKARGVGISLRPPVQTIVDTVRYLIDSDNIDPARPGYNKPFGGCVVM